MSRKVVTAIVRIGKRNYGFGTTVKSSIKGIESALEQAYGKENILVCNIKEV